MASIVSWFLILFGLLVTAALLYSVVGIISTGVSRPFPTSPFRLDDINTGWLLIIAFSLPGPFMVITGLKRLRFSAIVDDETR